MVEQIRSVIAISQNRALQQTNQRRFIRINAVIQTTHRASIRAAEDGQVGMMEGASKRWAAPFEWVEEGAADFVVVELPPPPVELETKYCSGVEYVKRSKSAR